MLKSRIAWLLTLLAVGLCAAQAAPELRPRWSVNLPLTRAARFIWERDAVYIPEADRITCINTSDGSVRWQTKLPPHPDDRFKPLHPVLYLTDEAVCVGRRSPGTMLDIIDRDTGKLRGHIFFPWKTLHGLVAFGRFAIVCIGEPNFPDKVQLVEIDLVTGKQRYDRVSNHVGFSLSRPYYDFGGQLFRTDRSGGRPNLVRLPLFDKPYGFVYAPKHIWLLPRDRALVSHYDPFQWHGAGAELALWDLKPLKKRWAIGIPTPESGIRDFRPWTKYVLMHGKEVWLGSGGNVYVLKEKPELVKGLAEVFKVGGDLFALRRRQVNGVWREEILRRDGDGRFRLRATLPIVSGPSRELPMGETLLRHSYPGPFDKETHRLELFDLY